MPREVLKMSAPPTFGNAMKKSDAAMEQLRNTTARATGGFEQMRKMTERAIAGAEQTRKMMARASAAFSRMLAELPLNLRRVQPYLAEKGWYLSGEVPIPLLARVADMVARGDDNGVESIMQEFAQSRIEATLKEIKERWPLRVPVLEDAFGAHRQGTYTLSIPAMLAQADGICFDILGTQLFGTKPKKALARVVDAQTVLSRRIPLDPIVDLFLEPLRTPSSVAENTRNRDTKRAKNPSYGPLNRHAVLHGLQPDYGSEPNSLRAIMLIDYLAQAEGILQKHKGWAAEVQNLIGSVK